jgi:hypothetical protein
MGLNDPKKEDKFEENHDDWVKQRATEGIR